MPTDTEFKRQIEASLRAFSTANIKQNALEFFELLGYKSERTITFSPNNSEGFLSFLKANSISSFNEAKAHLEEWSTIDFLFQLTDEEISRTKSLFDSNKVDISEERFESYIFFAIRLRNSEYRRSHLAEITREINKAFPMPAMILFQHGETLTFSIIDRRINKRDESKDVLKKVTLIKDIRIENPHRAHVEILSELALDNYQVSNFVELHKAWQKTLDTKELNKKFFQELANWYFWAVESIEFPDDEEKNDEVRNATNVIRLITRLIFVWFLKEKGLVSPKLFDEAYLKTILKFEDESAYYKAILQNLFFATLNSEMGKREFITESNNGRNPQHFIHNVFRYKNEFNNPDKTVKELFEPIPFLNGGLFECLDKEIEIDNQKVRIRVDGFSGHKKNPLFVPNELFFVQEDHVDLSDVYDDARKSNVKVRGLINILNSYKFTIAENTPIEEEIALDPELLGRVFENLLASYNPETKTTARKQTGSFYTPREIVNYMVDESLLAYLKQKLLDESEGFGFIAIDETQATMFGNEIRTQQKFEIPLTSNRWQGNGEELELVLRDLFSYSTDVNTFNETETEILIRAIDDCKILDPACGSGAFPMGILHRLVHLLEKLDTHNEKWRKWQRIKAIRETEEAYKIGDYKEREEKLLEINDVFENNASDYGRKLFLIENCIYGVDIQPIAIQISKLRFFISLVVDQKTNGDAAHNIGIRPLPNLETKFVAANTLVGLETNGGLKPIGVTELEKELKEVRANHFGARSRKTKDKYRAEDKRIRSQISDLLKQGGINETSADLITTWNPYDQNAFAKWFDAEWMFGVENGFDVVIGNPPYGAELSEQEKAAFKQIYSDVHLRTPDTFNYFISKSVRLLNYDKTGFLSFIVPNNLLFQNEYKKTRAFLLQNNRMLKALNLGDEIFTAIVPSCVILISNESKTDYAFDFSDLRNRSHNIPIESLLQSHTEFRKSSLLETPGYVFGVSEKSIQIITKVEKRSVKIDAIADEVAMGISSGGDKVFRVSEQFAKDNFFEAGILKKVLRGREINKYSVEDNNHFIIYTNKSVDIDSFPKVFSYLQDFKQQLSQKRETKKGTLPWWCLHWPRYPELFEEGKILIRQTSDRIIATIDYNSFFTLDSLLILKLKKNSQYQDKFVLAILNSKLCDYIYRQISQEEGRIFAQVKSQNVRKLFIPRATDIQQDEIVRIVDKIIEDKKRNQNDGLSILEQQINAFVYQLYQLTDEEIQIVEGAYKE